MSRFLVLITIAVVSAHARAECFQACADADKDSRGCCRPMPPQQRPAGQAPCATADECRARCYAGSRDDCALARAKLADGCGSAAANAGECYDLATLLRLGDGGARDVGRSQTLDAGLCARDYAPACERRCDDEAAAFGAATPIADATAACTHALDVAERVCRAGTGNCSAVANDYRGAGHWSRDTGPSIQPVLVLPGDPAKARELAQIGCDLRQAGSCWVLASIVDVTDADGAKPRALALRDTACQLGDNAQLCWLVARDAHNAGDATTEAHAYAKLRAILDPECAGGAAGACLALARMYRDGDGLAANPAKLAAYRDKALAVALKSCPGGWDACAGAFDDCDRAGDCAFARKLVARLPAGLLVRFCRRDHEDHACRMAARLGLMPEADADALADAAPAATAAQELDACRHGEVVHCHEVLIVGGATPAQVAAAAGKLRTLCDAADVEACGALAEHQLRVTAADAAAQAAWLAACAKGYSGCAPL